VKFQPYAHTRAHACMTDQVNVSKNEADVLN